VSAERGGRASRARERDAAAGAARQRTPVPELRASELGLFVRQRTGAAGARLQSRRVGDQHAATPQTALLGRGAEGDVVVLVGLGPLRGQRGAAGGSGAASQAQAAAPPGGRRRGLSSRKSKLDFVDDQKSFRAVRDLL